MYNRKRELLNNLVMKKSPGKYTYEFPPLMVFELLLFKFCSGTLIFSAKITKK